nr:MAG TPA: ribonucleoside-diphosphate reductase subunit alpha [Caudoviricetes sp.]
MKGELLKNLNEIYIVKNNGSKELYNADKIMNHVQFACKDLKVSSSDLVMNARLKITDGIKSKDIQKSLIQAANEMISEDSPDYEIVAGRLLIQQIRKEVYNQYEHLDFYEEIKKRVNQGFYDPEFLTKYTKDEIDYFGSKIRYEDDDNLPYISVNQMYSKYMIKNQGKVIETIPEVFMLIPMAVFINEVPDRRKDLVLKTYKLLNQRKISFPTPIMNGARTSYKHFISCNLIHAGDSVRSLARLLEIILMCTAAKSGIGINASDIRGLGADIGDPIRLSHTGILPIMKAVEAAVGSLSQISRGGSATVTIPFYHYESELFSQLGDAKGTIENRTRHLDQSIILNNWFLKKALNKEFIYLFHTNEVPELYNVLGDENKFNEVYEKYAKIVKAKHKLKVNAWDLLNLFIYERSFSGRVYFVFADNCTKGMFKETVYSSNLCQEIMQPAKPLDGSEGEPEVGVCILAGLNLGYAKLEDIPEITEVLVNFLDNLIDIEQFTIPEAEYAAKNRRSLGIGISNLFGYLAKSKLFYNSKDTQQEIFQIMEHFYYGLLKASNELAKVKGACNLFNETKYSDGYLHFDSYKLNFDLSLDWDTLRNDIKEYGLRNSNVSAIPPFGNSSAVSNSTSGVEPPRELVTTKTDKNVTIKKLVPFYKTSKNYYTTAWGDDFNNIDYFKLLGCIQPFIDQAISTNQYTNTIKKPNKQVPLNEVLEEILTANKVGLKTLYYQNFLNSDDEDGLKESNNEGCASGGCSV